MISTKSIYLTWFRLGTLLTSLETIPIFHCLKPIIFFKNTLFSSTISEWNNLDPNLRNSDTYGTFKNSILRFLRLFPNIVFKCRNLQGIKFLTTLCLGLSHLREHKFKHSFKVLWIYHVNAVLTLNQHHISCSTASFTTMIPRWEVLTRLIVNY